MEVHRAFECGDRARKESENDLAVWEIRCYGFTQPCVGGLRSGGGVCLYAQTRSLFYAYTPNLRSHLSYKLYRPRGGDDANLSDRTPCHPTLPPTPPSVRRDHFFLTLSPVRKSKSRKFFVGKGLMFLVFSLALHELEPFMRSSPCPSQLKIPKYCEANSFGSFE